MLYWIPWLAKLRQDLQIDPARIIPISRGGAAAWYEAPMGAELYACRTPKDVRVENRLQYLKTKMMKQTTWTPFDRQVVRDVAETMKLTRYLTLHPSWMYRDLMPFFQGHEGLSSVLDRGLYTSWAIQGIPDTLKLPPAFAAVRFYFRPTFPVTDQVKGFCDACVQTIATHTPVVLITAGLMTDDHVDYLPKGPNIQRLDEIFPMTAETNLMVQAAVIGRSVGFVGTYGGMAQLAIRLGRPTVNFYTDWHSTSWSHRHLSDYLATAQGLPCYTVKLNDIPVLHKVLPQVHVIDHGEKSLALEEVPA